MCFIKMRCGGKKKKKKNILITCLPEVQQLNQVKDWIKLHGETSHNFSQLADNTSASNRSLKCDASFQTK